MTGKELFIYKVKHSKTLAETLDKLFVNGTATLCFKEFKFIITKQKDNTFKLMEHSKDLGTWSDLFWLSGKIIEVARC